MTSLLWKRDILGTRLQCGFCVFFIFLSLLLSFSPSLHPLTDPNSSACRDEKGASSRAAFNFAMYQLASGLPSALTIGIFSTWADYRGRKPVMILQFIVHALNMLAVYLVPADQLVLLLILVAVCQSFGGQYSLGEISCFRSGQASRSALYRVAHPRSARFSVCVDF